MYHVMEVTAATSHNFSPLVFGLTLDANRGLLHESPELV